MFALFRDSFTRSESRMLFYGFGHNILKPHASCIFSRYFVLHEMNMTLWRFSEKPKFQLPAIRTNSGIQSEANKK